MDWENAITYQYKAFFWETINVFGGKWQRLPKNSSIDLDLNLQPEDENVCLTLYKPQ